MVLKSMSIYSSDVSTVRNALVKLSIGLTSETQVTHCNNLFNGVCTEEPQSSRTGILCKYCSFSLHDLVNRNQSYWNQSVPSVQFTVKNSKQVVKLRIMVVMPKNVRRNDLEGFYAL